MKHLQIKIILTAAVAALMTLTAGCNRTPNISTAQASDSQPRVEAEPFHGEVYRSLDGRTALTLISRDECELRSQGTTLLCKYTRQADALRVVATAFGTNQVIYYRFTPQGIQDNEGAVLLSPNSYDAAMTQIRLQREREEEARRAAERQRQQDEERQRAEEQRVAKVIQESKTENRVIQRFPLVVGQFTANYDASELTITDASIKLKYTVAQPDGPTVVPFSDVTEVYRQSGDDNVLHVDYPMMAYGRSGSILTFRNESTRNSAMNVLLQAMESWKKKFPEAARTK